MEKEGEERRHGTESNRGEREREKKGGGKWECSASGERETEIMKASHIQYFLFELFSLLQRGTRKRGK